jgi:NarL family two-component system response regulator LiaR
MTFPFLNRHKQTIGYGILLALLMFALKWLELRLLIFSNSFEIFAGIIAVLFTALGIWLALKLARPKVETVLVEKQVFVNGTSDFMLNEDALTRLNISRRELEVLQLMAGGMSNQEIAESLFVSLNTIKTHSARIFEKMDVKRRTQAVQMGKQLGLLP